jgi:integrase
MKKPEPGVRKDAKRGTWYFVADAPGVDGRRRQVKRRGFATMDEANEAVRAFRREVEDRRVPVPSDDSVTAFAEAWIAALPTEGVEPATVKHYTEAIARLLPTIGATRLQDLTALELDRAYAVLLDAGRSARTVRASHIAARKMLAEALRLGKVGRNVSGDARPPRARAARAKQFETWTYEEMTRFLDAVADHEHADLWRVAAWTGMRQGELVALQWSDIDLEQSAIMVRRSVGRGPDGYYAKRPKSDAGKRTVELDGPLVDVLRRHRKAQQERRLALGAGWRGNDLVFCEVDGAPIDANRLSKRWSDLVRRNAPKADVPVIRFHDLRHSHATQLLAANVRPDVVTERLGHASVAFTLQQYAHRYAGDQRSGLDRLRAAAR